MYDDDDNEIYEDEAGKRVEKAGKDALNTAKNAGKRKLKEGLKNILKKFGLKWLFIVGVVVVVIVMLASFWWAVTTSVFDEISKLAIENTSDSSGEIKKITQIDEDKRELIIDSDTYIKNKIQQESR